MTDKLKVYVWRKQDTDPLKATYLYMEVGHPVQEYPQSEVSFREFCEALDDYGDERYSQGSWLIERIFSVPPGHEGEPLDETQRSELDAVLCELG